MRRSCADGLESPQVYLELEGAFDAGGCLRPSRRAILWVEAYSESTMSLNDLETAVTQLPEAELAAFARWFDEYRADAWDRRIEADALAGRLDKAAKQADEDFDAGRCTPL